MTHEEVIDSEVDQLYTQLDLIGDKKIDGTDNGHPPPSVSVIADALIEYAANISDFDYSLFTNAFGEALIGAMSAMFELGNRMAELGAFTRDLEQCQCFMVPDDELESILKDGHSHGDSSQH